jgi:lysosomal acid lipase/cholesteryl ester hydrolase
MKNLFFFSALLCLGSCIPNVPILSKVPTNAKPGPFVATDPELNMNASQLITHWGYPVEQYDVTSEDGYISYIFRIPRGRNETTNQQNKPVVFMQHGLECDCTNWITNLPSESAAFVFADNGFDVWLGNARGNTYGLRHLTMSYKNTDFWQFTWDEMAKYDIPAQVNAVLSMTNQTQLYYMGHSEGTLVGFAQFSQDKEFAKKIKQFYALGPVSTVKHVKGPLRWIAPFTNEIDFLCKIFGYNEFLPNSIWMDMMAEFFCGDAVLDDICDDVLFLIAGPDSTQLNTSRVPVYVSHTPAGTSTNNVVHFGQMIKSGLMQMFDYGSKKKNKQHYNQDKPPVYDVTQMETPVALFYGSDDWLADPTDVQGLIPKLKNLFSSNYLVGFNHLDFIWGMRASQEVYLPIVNMIKADLQSK